MKYLQLLFWVGILVLIASLFAPTPVQASGWLDGYSYRRLMTVTGSTAGAVTNYPIQLTVYSGSGTDNGSEVYLANHAAASFDDLRFTTADGTTQLHYWIATKNSTSATVWVLLDSLAQAPATTSIYLYSGNSAVTSASDVTNMFLFYDGFDTDGISSWSPAIENQNGTDLSSSTASNEKFISAPNAAKLSTYASCRISPYDGVGSLLSRNLNLPQGNYKVHFSVLRDITGFRYSTTGYETSQVRINGLSQYSEDASCSAGGCTVTGSWTPKSVTVLNGTIDSLTLSGSSFDCTDGNVWYDNVFIRKYIDPEPAVTAWDTVAVTSSGSTSSNESSNPTHSISAPACNEAKPSGVSTLFQIDANATQAKLYFSPILGNNRYFISYGPTSQAEAYGVMADLSSDGVQQFQINALMPGATYYFKVRGDHGCMPGDWSNTMTVTTSRFPSAHLIPFYWYTPHH